MTPFPLFFFFFLYQSEYTFKNKPGFASAATYWEKKKKKTQKHSKESKMLDYSTHESEISLKKLSEKKRKNLMPRIL